MGVRDRLLGGALFALSAVLVSTQAHLIDKRPRKRRSGRDFFYPSRPVLFLLTSFLPWRAVGKSERQQTTSIKHGPNKSRWREEN